ncbi:UNVERIFIED_CONTAM: hypothetical protein FKN15_015143 [Acipenser sinensis]
MPYRFPSRPLPSNQTCCPGTTEIRAAPPAGSAFQSSYFIRIGYSPNSYKTLHDNNINILAGSECMPAEGAVPRGLPINNDKKQDHGQIPQAVRVQRGAGGPHFPDLESQDFFTREQSY